MKKQWYYRVYDAQRGVYFATGYNATSIKDLVCKFQGYIQGADDVPKKYINSWKRIADHLTEVYLEKSNYPFNEDEIL
jgi:hypothetical protein